MSQVLCEATGASHWLCALLAAVVGSFVLAWLLRLSPEREQVREGRRKRSRPRSPLCVPGHCPAVNKCISPADFYMSGRRRDGVHSFAFSYLLTCHSCKMLGAFLSRVITQVEGILPTPGILVCDIKGSIFFLHPKWKGPGVRQVEVRPLVCAECLSSSVPLLSCPLPLLPFRVGERPMSGCRHTIHSVGGGRCWGRMTTSWLPHLDLLGTPG